jgi:site-specific DNA-methyltransferase (adenine-specific)
MQNWHINLWELDYARNFCDIMEFEGRNIELPFKPCYEWGDFALYQAECINFMDSLPSECIDMIFADPPYNLSNNGFTCQSGKRVSVNKGEWDKSEGIENDFAFHFDWIKACRRILKPSGTIWISGTYHSIYACGYALCLMEYKILNDIIWFKPNAAPNLSGRYFAASHETLIWARKNPRGKHVFNYQLIKNRAWPGDYIKNPGKQMRSVWVINTTPPNEKKCGKHPTQKPMSLLERIILASTKEGDLIYDPFSGSSTTGLAANKHGRAYIGTELDTDYLELSIKRHKALLYDINNRLF